MTCPSVVRVARPEDHQEIWRLFLQGHRENGMFRLAPQKVEWYVQRALRPDLIPDWDTGVRTVIGVIGDRGATLEALCVLAIAEYWYTDQKHIEEFIVYTDPECRKSGHVHALHDWMKAQVHQTAIPLMSGVISNHRTEAKCRLYQRTFQKVGEFFLFTPTGFQMATVSSSHGQGL